MIDAAFRNVELFNRDEVALKTAIATVLQYVHVVRWAFILRRLHQFLSFVEF